VLELDIIFKSIFPAQAPWVCPQLTSQTPALSAKLATPAPAAITSGSPANPGMVSYSSKLCTNCGQKGHWVSTCFDIGGGMKGQRMEYKRDKGKVIAMLLAALEESYDSQELESPASDIDSPPDLSPLDTYDDQILIPTTTANLSMSSTIHAQNENLCRDPYPMCEPSKF
jgi:hypothetical protein